jgi:hypothetical protein
MSIAPSHEHRVSSALRLISTRKGEFPPEAFIPIVALPPDKDLLEIFVAETVSTRHLAWAVYNSSRSSTMLDLRCYHESIRCQSLECNLVSSYRATVVVGYSLSPR